MGLMPTAGIKRWWNWRGQDKCVDTQESYRYARGMKPLKVYKRIKDKPVHLYVTKADWQAWKAAASREDEGNLSKWIRQRWNKAALQTLRGKC